MIGKNIVIDFSIIQNSNPESLVNELELLIARKNNIYVWSNKYTPEEMRFFCLKIAVNLNEEEKHKKIIELRKQKKSFQDISEETGVPIEQISFYLTTRPDKIWTLDDWVLEYLVKDSSVYQKADFVIDPDIRFVERFKARGLDGNVIISL
jgi:hypothetical protein